MFQNLQLRELKTLLCKTALKKLYCVYFYSFETTTRQTHWRYLKKVILEEENHYATIFCRKTSMMWYFFVITMPEKFQNNRCLKEQVKKMNDRYRCLWVRTDVAGTRTKEGYTGCEKRAVWTLRWKVNLVSNLAFIGKQIRGGGRLHFGLYKSSSRNILHTG